MDKRVGRIPAGQADSAKEWVLPEVAPDDADNNRVFKLRGNTAPGRFKEDKSDARVLRSWSEGRRATKKPQQPSKHAAVEHVPTADSPAEAPAQSASQGIDEHGPSVIATDDAYAKGFKKGEVEGFTQGEARGFEVGQQAGHEQVRRHTHRCAGRTESQPGTFVAKGEVSARADTATVHRRKRKPTGGLSFRPQRTCQRLHGSR